MYAAVGIHPHEATLFEQEADELRGLLSAPKVVALGEIGLDYLRCHTDRADQHRAFVTQLGWAEECRLPVSVHNREADDDVMAALEPFKLTVVLHCFGGTESLAERALACGYYLSFAGNLTYRKADALRTVAYTVPTNRVLVETDSPVLAPQGHRGRRNEPAHVTEVAQALANVYGVEYVTLCDAVTRNADRVFGWRMV